MSSSRRDYSLRADARARYQASTLSSAAAAPPPPAAEARAEASAVSCAEPAPAPLSVTDRARGLYEYSCVPVREIALLVEVTERTIYRYAQKGQWRRRYRKPARGAGGRFVPLAQADAPHPQGLKATDPAGAARAAEACREAAVRAASAHQAALKARDARADRFALGHLALALRELSRLGREAKPGRAKAKQRVAGGKDGKPRRRGYQWRPGYVSPLPPYEPRPVAPPPPSPPAPSPPAFTVAPEVERRINEIVKEYEAREREKGPRIRKLW